MSIARKLMQVKNVDVGAWDLSYAVRNGGNIGFFGVAAQEAIPEGLFFKPDGTKMYITGQNSDRVHEYDLSVPWEVPSASFVQNVLAGDNVPTGLFFKPDGTRMYVAADAANTIREFALSTPWDVSTATFTQAVAAGDSGPKGVFFDPSGVKMYVVGIGADTVREFTLSTPWDVSTATFIQAVAAGDATPEGVSFKPDGTRMYVVGSSGDTVREFTLSGAWDVSTAVFTQSFSVAAQTLVPADLYFREDGTRMYVMDRASDGVRAYQLSVAWDVSTASYIEPTSGYLLVNAQENQPQSVFFRPDGRYLYVAGISNSIYLYSLSVSWDLSTASYLGVVFTTGADLSGAFFKPDGTEMFLVVGFNTLARYVLSPPWDGTVTFIGQNNLSLGDDSTNGVYIKPDGTKVYTVGSIAGFVREFDLSTPWDVTTMSLGPTLNVAGQDAVPTDIFFRPNGTKMYITGSAGSAIYEYALGSAWDISTAVYTQSFSVAAQSQLPQGLFFKANGTEAYMTGGTFPLGAVWKYDIG